MYMNPPPPGNSPYGPGTDDLGGVEGSWDLLCELLAWEVPHFVQDLEAMWASII